MILLPPRLVHCPGRALAIWSHGAPQWQSWGTGIIGLHIIQRMERVLMPLRFPWPRRRRAALLASVSLLASCTVGPDFERPTPPETKGYTEEKEGLPPLQVTDAKEAQQRLLLGQDIPGEW